MRKIIFTICLLIVGLTISAQDILKFKGIPISGDIETFNQKMKEQNFYFLDDLYYMYYYFGMFYGRKVSITVEYNPETRQVASVGVTFPEQGEEALKMYERVGKQLDQKYKTKNESYLSDVQSWNYGKDFEIRLSLGQVSKKVILLYSNIAKSKEVYLYKNNHPEWMKQHQNDL